MCTFSFSPRGPGARCRGLTLIGTNSPHRGYFNQPCSSHSLSPAPHLFSPLPSFNLLSFAEDLRLWRDTLVETTDAACHEAMQWVTHLRAHGSTSILHALLASSTTEPNPISQTEIPSPPYRYCTRLSNYKGHFQI